MNPQVITVAGDNKVTVTGQTTLQVVTIPESVKTITVGIQGPAGPGGDKNYIQPFTSLSTVNVTHNLGKYPAVTVVDSAGDECEGFVQHLTTNSLVITFSAPFTGSVYCN